MSPALEISPVVETNGTQAKVADSERLWIIGIGFLVVMQTWLGLIGSSLWLDEAGTWWIVKDGAAEAVRRSFYWTGPSISYYLAAAFSVRLFGLNEIGLRIPSILAMCGATWFIFRIAERLYDRTAAYLAAFVFLCMTPYFAIDARPYGMAIFFLTLATWALIRWVDGNRPFHAILHVVAGALVVYTHCIMALGLVAGLAYGVNAAWKQPRRLIWLAGMQIAAGILCLPLVPKLMVFYVGRAAHTVSGPPSVDDLLLALIPASISGALILGLGLDFISRRKAGIEGKNSWLTAVLIGTMAVFPIVFLFLLSVTTDLRLFVDRYYSSALAGQALLIGGILASIDRPLMRRALIIMVGVITILVNGRLMHPYHGKEDWRAAMKFVNGEAKSAPVLLVSPFAEGADFKAIRDPKLGAVLFAPELVYGMPARAIFLPHVFDPGEARELERTTEQLKNEPHFYLVNDKPDRSFELWLLGRFGSRCKSETTGKTFGYVWIARITCGEAE